MEHVVDPLVKKPSTLRSQSETIGFVVMIAALVMAPFVTYPLFLMQAMCFALFACAFNLIDRICRPVVIRPCALFWVGKLPLGVLGEGVGLST